MSSFPLSAVTADVTSLGCQGCHDSSLKALSAVTADGSSSIRVNFYKFLVLDRGGWSSLPISAVTADVTTQGGQGGHGSPLKVPSAVTADGSSECQTLLSTSLLVEHVL